MYSLLCTGDISVLYSSTNHSRSVHASGLCLECVVWILSPVRGTTCGVTQCSLYAHYCIFGSKCTTQWMYHFIVSLWDTVLWLSSFYSNLYCTIIHHQVVSMILVSWRKGWHNLKTCWTFMLKSHTSTVNSLCRHVSRHCWICCKMILKGFDSELLHRGRQTGTLTMRSPDTLRVLIEKPDDGEYGNV